ncbi:hypothetical protein J3Q64DRAFT_1835722 [Phycomyces blakesleeanus]|uniref:F-box domain-containing protein n=2 Tax=Phycomyces blakesleeanus TaxID=4837 RepID=A0A162TZJ3_PHYB8|nr:hypothetical protein PHYBLDRAFT_146474 [Phycomyces blakesleeanus NRRL 1555(-)]OAD72272.1 hypothetical protein PHYBLDRAFT_146474 [Phycomyces blakesleeanus NRRL 1555(-)]|eukprot:XP_018290312.1 hypothetical protein PHYBLDRAFT_146474 [Phycomyces blakesleeanus NRRL 1555(-)]
MLASQLPFEILAHIASFLLVNDRIPCVQTCKSWKTPFEESLWDTVEISSRLKLFAVCSSANPSQNIYQKYGHLVRKLDLYGNFILSDTQLSVIQQRFPNLRHFKTGKKNISKTSFGRTADWNSWTSLTKLCVDTTRLGYSHAEKNVLEVLSCLPSLTELELEQYNWEKIMIFELKDFETLHMYLPRIEHLSIQLKFASLTPEHLSQMEKATPAISLKSFKLGYGSLDLRWICYFARKYPNIRLLEWAINDDEDLEYEHEDETMRLLTSLPYVFPHLNTARMYSSGNPDQLHLTFWKLLRPFNVPIKDLINEFCYHKDEKARLERNITECVNAVSETVEIFNVIGYDFRDPQIISTGFNNCSRLVDLNIHECNTHITLNSLLDHCVSLKRLRFSLGSISIKQKKIDYSITHGLRILDVTGATVESETFNYLSLRCRQLNYMRLNGVNVTGIVYQDTGCLCLNMPYTDFKLLHIHCVQFYQQSVNSLRNSNLNLVSLSLSSSVAHNDQTKIKNRSTDIRLYNNIYSRYLASSIWFHTFCEDLTIYRGRSKVRILEEEEVSYAYDYYHSGHFHDSKNTESSEEVYRSNEGNVAMDKWHQDLPRGYAELKCEYIAKYDLRLEKTYDDRFWQNVYNGLTKS